MESHLTLCSLHKGQTTLQVRLLLLRPSLISMSPHSWCQGRPEVENGLNFRVLLDVTVRVRVRLGLGIGLGLGLGLGLPL